MTYFVTSDIHSFGKILIDTLQKKGFDIANPEHILIICGDIFDRGPDTVETYEFLKSIPADRLILIKGNHELLYLDLLEKDFPERHDFNNGTVKTFCAIAGESVDLLDRVYIMTQEIAKGKVVSEVSESTSTILAKNWKRIRNKVKKSEITKFIKSKSWVNYYEIPGYVFVHSFVPTKVKDEWKSIQSDLVYFLADSAADFCEYDPNWRQARSYAWDEATWGCPWRQFREGLFKEPDKNLVVGHWHTSDFYNNLLGANYTPKQNPIYNEDGLIGLDACTAISKKINVLVIEG